MLEKDFIDALEYLQKANKKRLRRINNELGNENRDKDFRYTLIYDIISKMIISETYVNIVLYDMKKKYEDELALMD